MVLLHAGIADGRMWDDHVGALAGRYLVVRPDLRGYGRSPLPAGPFSYVEDIRALLDELGLERAALVGVSFGGRIALDVALSHPDRVAALVLVSSGMTGSEDADELARFDAEEESLLEAGDVDAAVELNLRWWVDGPRRAPGAVPPAVRERIGAMQRQAFATILAAYEREPHPGPVAWPTPPAAVRLAEVGVRTLVVVGDDDLPYFAALGERLAAGIPGARLVRMAGVAHMAPIERPAEFGEIVLGFLADAIR